MPRPARKALIDTVLASAAVRAARLLRDTPGKLERWTAITGKYIDWREATIVCRTQFGARMLCSLNDMIQRKIAYFGLWEPNLTAYLSRTLKPGDTFVDVGANIGYHTLLASSLVGPSGKVVAIEASPSIFSSLCRNIQSNHATNVRTVNRAAAYEPGDLPVFTAAKSNIGRTTTIPIEGNTFEGFVRAEPLQKILSTDELAKARIVKIDIEGAEGPVISSFLENVARYGQHCELVVEVSPDCSWVVEQMTEHGFFAYRISNDYGDRDYLRPSPLQPFRHRGCVEAQTDFIFSRRQADCL